MKNSRGHTPCLAVWALRQAFLLISITLCWQLAYAFEQQDVRTVHDDNGGLLGYVHEFNTSDSSRIKPAPIVFVPGFDLDINASLSSAQSAPPGSRAAGANLFKKLKVADTAQPLPFLQSLVNDAGYRVFVLEYATVESSVRDNAVLLQKFLRDPEYGIRSLYQRDGSRAIVFGWSMGGLVARYALNELENRQLDHYTDTYVSHETPHRGAYLPTSVETVFGLLQEAMERDPVGQLPIGFLDVIDKAVELFNSPAAREMLKIHIGRTPSESFAYTVNRRYGEIIAAPDTASAHADYYSLRTELLVNGVYPQQLHKVGVSNGSRYSESVPLPQPRRGNRIVTLTASSPVTSSLQLKLLELKLHDDSFTTSSSACSIRLMFKKSFCPSVTLPADLVPDPHTSLSTASGSVVNTFHLLANTFSSQPALEREWNNLDYSVEFDAQVHSGEGTHGFISIESALDLHESLATIGTRDLVDQSPFDAVYLSTTGNLPHHVVAKDVYQSLLNEFSKPKIQQDAMLAVLL